MRSLKETKLGFLSASFSVHPPLDSSEKGHCFFCAGAHGRKSRGDMGSSLPEFGVGDANANCPPKFCNVSKFQTPYFLHYNAVTVMQ